VKDSVIHHNFCLVFNFDRRYGSNICVDMFGCRISLKTSPDSRLSKFIEKSSKEGQQAGDICDCSLYITSSNLTL